MYLFSILADPGFGSVRMDNREMVKLDIGIEGGNPADPDVFSLSRGALSVIRQALARVGGYFIFVAPKDFLLPPGIGREFFIGELESAKSA